jgi:hyperosmotically inducible protein
MRRPIFATVLLLVIGIAVLYYVYNRPNRVVSVDVGAVQEYAGDVATTTSVKTALALNKATNPLDIHVATNNKVVTLSGQVPSAEDQQLAGEIALNTNGVTSIVNNTVVAPPPQLATAGSQDGNIKAAVLELILNNPDLRNEEVRVDVNNGDVKLSGRVATESQKGALESGARAIANVHNVDASGLQVKG